MNLFKRRAIELKLFIALFLVNINASSQSTGNRQFIIPDATQIMFEIGKDIELPINKTEPTCKVGDSVLVFIKEDVKIRDTIVIKQGTKATATIRELIKPVNTRKASLLFPSVENTPGQILVDVFDVTAVDGTIIPIVDFYLLAYNTKMPAGTVKSYKTPKSITINIP